MSNKIMELCCRKKGAIVYQFRQVTYVSSIPSDGTYIMGADIGGTNSNFGFFRLEGGRSKLYASWHYKSQSIEDFTDVIVHLLDQVHQSYGITIRYACFGAAGVVTPEQDFCKPTNLDIIIESAKLIEHTSLVCAPIINDFAVIGYGIPLVATKDIHVVQSGTTWKHGNQAILGAGTGLGKSILRWSESNNRYIPVSSEGGHADCSVQSQKELEIINFIKKECDTSCAISWEDVLSGNGIQRMYRYFSQQNGLSEGDTIQPDEIFAQRNDDTRAFQTFEMYTMFYARCAKNFALDALSLGGLYIAGGIAAKNIQLFELEAFRKEFVNCEKQKKLLADMPIRVVGDYNVSLYGAAEYLIAEKKCSSN